MPRKLRMATEPRPTEELPELTSRIIETYSRIGRINHLGHCPLPNSHIVLELMEDLREVIFPGYRRRQNLHAMNIAYHVGGLIDSVHSRLSQQIARALRHEHVLRFNVSCGDANEIDFDVQGETKSLEFLGKLVHVRELLATDVQAAFDGDPAASGLDEIIFCYPGLEAVTIQRLAHELYLLDVPFIPRMMTEWAHSRTGIDIHPGANIGPSFFIDHGTGVVIGETCDIASNVKLYQGVTLGAISFPKDAQGNLIRGKKRHPTIEDGVVIYANATILGGETVVGAGSVVGASVYLHASIPPNTVVTIDPPQLRFRDASLRQTS